MAQMGSALDEKDIEAFWIWTCIASAIAGFPFMATIKGTLLLYVLLAYAPVPQVAKTLEEKGARI